MRRFTPGDLDTMNEWYAARGLPRVPRDALPAVGFIVDKLAAGFLYRTDAPGLALVDGVVTAPDAPRLARAKAVEDVVRALSIEARKLRIPRVVGLTSVSGMSRLCERLGWTRIGTYQLLRKDG